MVAIKIIVVLMLSLISFQDIKSREVYWFLFPLVGIVMTILFFKTTIIFFYSLNVSINLGVVITIISVLYSYATLKMKLNFWKEAFGAGDALFFIAFAISFPTITFLILFVGALIFSLVIGAFFNLKKKKKTIPLAGYMSLFLIVVFVTSWVTSVNLYLV